MTTPSHDDKSITELFDDLGVRLAYHDYLNKPDSKLLTFEEFAEQQAKPKRYVGCWSEENNSEWAGFASGTFATPEEAKEAARKSARGCRRGVIVWANEAKDEL